MSGLIPESFIEQLLERVDIVDVVGQRVPLKPAGHEFKACCPFHDEKTPSFYVSPQKQFYHCFGCGAHGTAIGFVMQYDGLEFPAAIEELASGVGLEVPHEGGTRPDDGQKRRRETLYAALDAAHNLFRNRLRASESARAYLERRGLDAATIDEFGIGFAPDEWAALSDRLLRDGFSADVLEQAGLSGRARNGNLIDKFRNRIMFPIHDRRGRVVAFGGRALGDDGPKYLNSAESPVFHKGRELYRLYQARKGGLPERLLVVEGYMDAAALYQFGFDNAVATLGTAVTAEHLALMYRATSVVVFCFDGDAAGRRAAWKALEAALPEMRSDREARFLFLPEGEDPDTLLRSQGAGALTGLIDEALPLSQFLFDELGRKLDLTAPDGRARLAAQAETLLSRLPSGPFAELMAQELASRTGLRAAATPAMRRSRPAYAGGSDRPLTPVQYAVAVLIQHPELAAQVDPGRLEVPGELKGVRFLSQLIDFCREKPNITSAQLIERWRDAPEGRHLAELARRELAIPGDDLGPALAEVIGRIRRQQIRSRVAELQRLQAAGELDAEQTHELRHWLSNRESGDTATP